MRTFSDSPPRALARARDGQREASCSATRFFWFLEVTDCVEAKAQASYGKLGSGWLPLGQDLLAWFLRTILKVVEVKRIPTRGSCCLGGTRCATFGNHRIGAGGGSGRFSSSPNICSDISACPQHNEQAALDNRSRLSSKARCSLLMLMKTCLAV